MRRTLVAAVMLVATLGSAMAQGADPAFPMVFDFNGSTQRWANQSPINEQSASEWRADGGRTGGGIYMKGTGGPADQMRVWRKVIANPPPPAGRQLHVSAWVKGAGVEADALVCVQAHAPRSASLAGFATTQVDSPLRGTFDWTEVRTTLDVPRGIANAQVMLMLVGNGEVWFDDVKVELGGEAMLIVPGVFEVRGAVGVSSADARVIARLPVPIDDAEQCPVSYRVDVEPPERFVGARVEQGASGTWEALVELDGVTPDAAATVVRWSSVVVVAPTGFSGVPGAAPMPAAWPNGIRQWLAATRLVASADEEIVKLAAEVRGDSGDVMEIVRRTLDRLKEDAAAGPANVGVPAMIAARAARLAALLRANGIPARLVRGVPGWAGETGELWLAEAFVPSWGWYPIEVSLMRAPWPNHQFVRLGIVGPDEEDAGPGEMGYRLTGVLAKGADLVCEPIRNFSEDMSAARWGEVMATVRARWSVWRSGGCALTRGEAAGGRDAAWFRGATPAEAERYLVGEER